MSKREQIAYALQRIEELTAEVAELQKLHGHPTTVVPKPSLVEDFRRGLDDREVVEVIRYLRKPSHCWSSNLGGVTLAFKLDYNNRVVTVAYSICNEEDNFEKALGTLMAQTRLRDSIDLLEIPMYMVGRGTYANYSLIEAMFFVLNNCTIQPSDNWKRIRDNWVPAYMVLGGVAK